MKSLNVKICALIAVFGLLMTFSSCNKSKDPGPGLVKFSVTSASFSEADNDDKNIEVSIGAKQSADVTVTWTWTPTGETYLDGDFSLPSTTAITIPAGQTIGHIVVHVIDDAQIDADDDLTLTLTAVTGNAKLSTNAADLSYDMTISNDDTTPPNAMQVDLTWSTGTTTSVDVADLDLYLNYGVVITSGVVTNNGTPLYSSENTSGFENLTMQASDPDDVYYVVANYYGGSGDVTFKIELNGLGQNGTHDSFNFAAANAGNATLFIGPFTKSGSAFGRQGALTPKDGKLLVYPGSSFHSQTK